MILAHLAEKEVTEAMVPCYFGDRSSSDTVVRLRTSDGRDDWLYCHSHILIEKSKYFADRLSEKWPTCQILDSRNCVEVYCQESDFDSHVNVLRLFYVKESSKDDLWHGVRNALGILRVAVELECPQIVSACVNYLEAVPWEETEEEEILKTIPGMGSQVLPILSRLEPVNALAIMKIFQSAIQLATSSPPQDMNDLKTSAQEQLEYMLTEDDDEPLLKADDEIRSDVKQCMSRLFARFNSLLESLLSESSELACEAVHILQFYLSDLSWACQILTKLDIMRDLVVCWMDASDKVVKIVCPSNPEPNDETIKTTLKTIEVAAKVLESIAYGSVILPASKRLHAVKVWLPFVRVAKPAIDSAMSSGDDAFELKVDGELWQSLESTFVSLVLTLPSGDQAEILSEWLGNNYIRYPDLTEAFDVWCYRSKVAKRRIGILDGNHSGSSMP